MLKFRNRRWAPGTAFLLEAWLHFRLRRHGDGSHREGGMAGALHAINPSYDFNDDLIPSAARCGCGSPRPGRVAAGLTAMAGAAVGPLRQTYAEAAGKFAYRSPAI